MSSEPQVVIVGGGLAGLACAAALAEQRVGVTVLESRPRLGGRASSFHDAESDTWIDNCQHVSMGCCTNFQHFCRQTGLDDFFRAEPALYFVGPKGRIHRFAAGPWPAPLHLAGAFSRLSYLSWSDKLALARGLKALVQEPGRGGPVSESFTQWLQRHEQPLNAVRYFWQVVLVSALSESLDRISVEAARKVFVDGFLSHREGWRVHIPTVPLEELYGGRLTQSLTERGVELRLLTAAQSLEMSDQRINGVRLKSGEVVSGGEFVIAVPHHRVLSLLPAEIATHPQLAGVNRLESAPISSLHLWFDRPIMDLPHAVFVDGLCQWVFNRAQLASDRTVLSGSLSLIPMGERVRVRGRSLSDTPLTLSSADGGEGTGEARTHYYQIVISASRDVVNRDSADVLQQVLAELAAVWPAVKSAELLHSRQVTEHRAVFSPLPGSEELRPLQQSPISNLQFAGDWTRTGWPATMEGAVRSGYLAAENVLRRLSLPAAVLQPDLSPSSLFRWLFRRN
jgi:squalene-associated FAD-dependent desaturase